VRLLGHHVLGRPRRRYCGDPYVQVSPGETLKVGVGASGVCEAGQGAPGTVGGGGAGGDAVGGAGGGASVIAASQSLPGFPSPFAVAGGGGGSGIGSGGDAGSPGVANGSAGGGGAGTNTGPGSAGAGEGRVNPPCGGGDGASGYSFGGGGGGTGGGTSGGGGGGGGGYFGGGGGGGIGCAIAGGSGGGGSSFIDPQATAVSGPTPTAAAPYVSIVYAVPTADASPSSLTFPTRPQGTSTAVQSVTVTNSGSAPLIVSSATVTGSNPGDYLVDNQCQAPVSPTNSCNVDVSFTPHAQGPSSASLTLTTNAATQPAPVGLSGTGGPPLASTAEESTSAISFPGTEPQGVAGAEQTLTVTNNGSAPLIVSAVLLAGSDPGDYLLNDRCQQPTPPGSSCQIGVRFAPQAQGPSSASLTLLTNAASATGAVALSGTGGQLPQGLPGTTGQRGPAGEPGPPGKVELITCRTVTKTVTRNHHKVHVKQQECTGKLISGMVTLTSTGTSVHASISRGRMIYATGASVLAGQDAQELLLTDRRPLHRGRYTLTLRHRHGRHWINRRMQITIR
jgi:Glycine rich protein